MTKKMCLECGVMPCKRGAIKYCSKECSLKNTAIQKQGYDLKLLKGHKPWNKGLSVHLSPKTEFRKGHSINLGRIRLDMRGENNPLWVPKINRECNYCKKELLLSPYQIKDRNFCNRTCWALGTRGKGSPVFKGEKAVSKLRNRVMQLPEYQEWRSKILTRDNWMCQLCGFRDKGKNRRPMEVDHIKRFLHIIQESGIIDIEMARNCKELWEISNGRTLCRPCHRTSDTYGTKGLKR